VFKDLKARLCRLSPNRSDIHEVIEKELNEEAFGAVLQEPAGWRAAMSAVLRFTCFHLDFLASLPHKADIFRTFEELRPLVEDGLPPQAFQTKYLTFAHGAVNRIAKELAECFKNRKAA